MTPGVVLGRTEPVAGMGARLTGLYRARCVVLGSIAARVGDQVLGVDHMVDLAVVDIEEVGDGAGLEGPVAAVAAVFAVDAEVRVVPGGFLEGRIPRLAVLIQQRAGFLGRGCADDFQQAGERTFEQQLICRDPAVVVEGQQGFVDGVLALVVAVEDGRETGNQLTTAEQDAQAEGLQKLLVIVVLAKAGADFIAAVGNDVKLAFFLISSD